MKRLVPLILWILIPASLFAQRSWDTIPYGPEGFRAAVERFKKEPVVKDKMLFLGNSIVEGANWKKLLKDSTVINRGISGDITFGILNRIGEVVQRRPSRVFLLIGINDISKGIPDEVIMENIFSIVRKIKSGSPKTIVYVQSILPTNNAYPQFPGHKNKDEHVVTINSQLQKYGERLGYTYVELYSKFLDTDSRLDSKYTTDGLHLNAAGYLRWVAILKDLNCL